jgi:hypothetical protein
MWRPPRWRRYSRRPDPSCYSPRVGGHVFISYSHVADRSYVDRLAAVLTSAGHSVWYDGQLAHGDRWAQVVRHNIDTCAAFIVVMTPDAEQSEWVEREIDEARESSRPILPLLLRGRRFFTLANIQYEDVSTGQLPGPDFMSRLSVVVSSSPVFDVVRPNPSGYVAAFTLTTSGGDVYPDPSPDRVARAARDLSPDNEFVILERADGWFAQVAHGGDAGAQTGGYAVEYQEGSIDQQYRAETGDLDDVVRFLTEYLAGQDDWKNRHTWHRLEL